MHGIREWIKGWGLFVLKGDIDLGNLNGAKPDAAFIPGLALAADQSRLTFPNSQAVEYAILLLQTGIVKKVIYSSNIS